MADVTSKRPPPPPVRTSTLRRLLGFVRPYRARVGGAVVASVACAAATAAYAYLVGPLLKAVVVGQAVHLGSAVVEGRRLLWLLPALLLGVATVKAVAQVLQTGWMQGAAQRILADLRGELYAHLLRLPPRRLDARHSGELLSRLTSDVTQVEFAVSQALASYVKDSLQVLALLVVCWRVDARLFCLAFIGLPLAVIPVSRFAKAVKRSAVSTQASLGRLTTLSAEALQNLPILQAFDGQARVLERFDAEQAHYLREMKRSLFVRGAFTPLLEGLGFGGVALAIGFGTQAVAHEPALAERLLTFLTAALLMYQPLKSLSGTFSLVLQGLGAAQRLFELEEEPQVPDAGDAAGPLAEALVFEDLRVRYDDGTAEALAGLRLRVPAGSKVALVGASGAGKSTAFSVLLGFVAPSGGRLLWDGKDVATLSKATLRARMAWVPQEPVLFSGTVRQNLLLARPESTEAELWRALNQAHADGFVRQLPEGLEEQVGERGARLSGGQRQRLAIARAFLRSPSLLLLDEPTSALDAASEAEVQAGLAVLMKGRTTLVIAHRLATVRDADLIYVLDAGKVVESGTHAELVGRQGAYAALLQQGELAAA